MIGPVQSVLNGGTAFEAITHSPAAVTFFVMSGVEHLYDVLVSPMSAKPPIKVCFPPSPREKEATAQATPREDGTQTCSLRKERVCYKRAI